MRGREKEPLPPPTSLVRRRDKSAAFSQLQSCQRSVLTHSHYRTLAKSRPVVVLQASSLAGLAKPGHPNPESLHLCRIGAQERPEGTRELGTSAPRGIFGFGTVPSGRVRPGLVGPDGRSNRCASVMIGAVRRAKEEEAHLNPLRDTASSQ